MTPLDGSTIERDDAGSAAQSPGWRGWIARRGAWRGIVGRSGLPNDVQGLIARITLAAGGNGRERVETASELVSHFVEAIERGTTPADAMRAFGDERQAARLFRRAIRRKRGLLSKAWWWSSRTAACVIAATAVAYTGLAIRFYSAEPVVRVQSINVLRALEPDVLPNEQAWPLYRPALLAIQRTEQKLAEENDPAANDPAANDPAANDWFSTTDPTSASWERGTALLNAHAEELRALREGARRTALGVRFGAIDPADAELFAGRPVQWPSDASDDNPPVFDVLPPYLAHLRQAARWLGADVLRAAHAGDGVRAVENIEAIIGLARQSRRALLVEQLVSLTIAGHAMTQCERALALAPASFDAGLCARLDRALAAMPSTFFTIDFRGETIGFEDFLQRVYTDDGAGDGHVTARMLEGDWRAFGRSQPGQLDAGDRVLGPGLLLTMPSRRALREAYERSIEIANEVASQPSWMWRDEATLARALSVGGLATGGWSDALLAALVHPTSKIRMATSGPWAGARCEVTRVIVALHRYRAERGMWPESLELLVGPFLDTLPSDPYTGEAIRYEVRDGRPTLWSVGEDGVDDRLSIARPAWTGSPLARIEWPGEADTARSIHHGDVQFWPLLDEKEPDTDPGSERSQGSQGSVVHRDAGA